jgi:hypothetical protein
MLSGLPERCVAHVGGLGHVGGVGLLDGLIGSMTNTSKTLEASDC